MSQPPNYGESEPTRPIDPSATPYSSPPGAPSSGGYSYPPAPAPDYSAPAAPSYPPASGAPGYPTSGAPGYQPTSGAGYQPTSGAPGYDPAAQQGGYVQPYQQPAYQQGYQQPGYQQPYTPPPAALDPQGRPYSDKTKMVTGLLNIFLPGVGRLYAGHIGIGIAQLLLFFLCGVGWVWSLIDGIMILVSGGTDGEGRVLRDS